MNPRTIAFLCAAQFAAGVAFAQTNLSSLTEAVRQKFEPLFQSLPAPEIHLDGVTVGQLERQRRADDQYRQLVREKIDGHWFAALVSEERDSEFAIQHRLATSSQLMAFLRERDALVEVWAQRAPGQTPRRIPAPELGALKQAEAEQPTYVTVTYPEDGSGRLVRQRVEFAFNAADAALAASRSYERHRHLQIAAREILAALDSADRPGSRAQWEALQEAAAEGSFALDPMPPPPRNSQDLFAAFEYEVDEFNNLARPVRAHRESAIHRQVRPDGNGRPVQVLILGDKRTGREVRGFTPHPVTGNLEPAPNPILGQDSVQLRIVDPRQPDARRWNVLEFGEPELLQQSALARFSLINAHLEKRRKEIAWKKSKVDLIAEPIIAGLNIGGGVAGVGFPIGEAGRLLFNLVENRFIADVPSIREMRELFGLLAARDRHPEWKTRPAEFLSGEDVEKLSREGRKLTDAEIETYLAAISDSDVQAMLRLARMQKLDARVTSFLNLLTSAGKVSGLTESGVLREIFNSPYFSVNGNISLKTLLAVSIGQKVMTPLSGVSLESLAGGDGPARAWVQFFDVTVDLRAIINTVARLSRRTQEDKELKKPFPYAPRTSDLAAYEIRLFGFPLLMFYKRGQLRAEQEAFLNDYAYGLVGAKLVETFPTREAMDAEIRAGRMAPLGFVRVPSRDGQWEETNLAVFAHRIPQGRHAGKTALIIYGLKAYEQHSELIERELGRFKQFETALQDGAVIEQLIEAEDRERLPSSAFEPRLDPGGASAERFGALLGGLSEISRYWKYHAWGTTLPPSELNEVANVFERFATNGLWLADGDPLLNVDPYGSSFTFRKRVEKHWRLVRMTLIPSLASIGRDLKKAESAARVEQARRSAVLPHGPGIALVNRVRATADGLEAGPLLSSAATPNGVASVTQALAWLAQLPVAARAQAQAARFSTVLMPLPGDGTEEGGRAFVTFEFPVDGEVKREGTNSLSGETEIEVYRDGLLRRTISARKITELEYGAHRLPDRTLTRHNAGSLHEPVAGAIIEETRALAHWIGPPDTAASDPYAPRTLRLRANRVTGAISRETFGLHATAISSADEQFVIENRFNDFGILQSSRVLENGNVDLDFARPWQTRLMAPIRGALRFEFANAIPEGELRLLRDLRSRDFRATLNRRDALTGTTNTVVLDQRHDGRILAESQTDSFDGQQRFQVSTRFEFSYDFFHGEVPVRSVTGDAASGAMLSAVQTLDYDPVTRMLRGVETDYRGQRVTNHWDWRWESPVQTETSSRSTVHQWDRRGTHVLSTTRSSVDGEELARSVGVFRPETGRWEIERTRWFRPGITNGTETLILSAHGKLMATRLGDSFEARPVYAPDGRETGVNVYRRDAASGPFDILHERSDDYRWVDGRRESRVVTFIEGRPQATFRRAHDAEGRLVAEGVRQLPGIDLRTVLQYDGASDRVTVSEELQNGAPRLTRTALGEQLEPDGSWHLLARTVPAWGLTSTQYWRLADPLGRLVETRYENGDRARVVEWFEGSAVAKVTETLNRHGRAAERFIRTPAERDHDGIPLDRTRRFILNFWGGAGWAEDQFHIANTDFPVFKEAAGERIYFDTAKNYQAPLYSVDPDGRMGVTVQIRGQPRSHVLRVFDARVRQPDILEEGGPSPALALQVDAVDLRGLFHQQITRQIFDPAGHLLDELTGRVLQPQDGAYTDAALRAALERGSFLKRFHYRYERGWRVEQSGASAGDRRFVFTQKDPGPGGRAEPVNEGGREMATEIEATQAATVHQLEPTSLKRYFFQRTHSPAQREFNPHLPDENDAWVSWITTELRTDGSSVFDSERYFNAQGIASATRALKTTTSGSAASRLNYTIAAPLTESWPRVTLAAGITQVELTRAAGDGAGADSSADFSRADFLYCFVRRPARVRVALRITDAAGRQVEVIDEPAFFAAGTISFWKAGQNNVRWLPSPEAPAYGAAVDAPSELARSGGLLIVCIPDLTRAGLNTAALARFELACSSAEAGEVIVSPIQRLAHGAAVVWSSERSAPRYEERTTASGLTLRSSSLSAPDARDRFSGRHAATLIELNGKPVAVTKSRSARQGTELVVMDSSDPEAQRPLYSLNARDGRFREHYLTLKREDAHVYTIVSGFEIPKFEVVRPNVLEDELSPGFLAYGYDYSIRIPFDRGSHWFSGAWAAVKNRIVANGFKHGLDNVRKRFAGTQDREQLLSHLQYASLHSSARQAEEISRLPTLAEALLPLRPVPWLGDTNTGPERIEVDRKKVALRLLEMHVRKHPGPGTGLIPTAPETSVERYVDTAREGDIVVLAVKLGELGLARQLLEFYRSRFEADREPLHASYDAMAGTAMTADPMFDRPLQARRTASAQIAIANAAFALGFKSGDAGWVGFGRELTTVLLDRFRSTSASRIRARGFTEHEALPLRRALGFTLWPAAETYSLASNARAAHLLDRLAQPEAAALLADERWSRQAQAALADLRLWFQEHILPSIARGGVPPKGLFEIQDIYLKSSALGPERWSSAEDWLALIEAAPALGIPDGTRRQWIENLARVHGTTVNGQWGLDWSLPILREDVISTELTAAFARLAGAAGHEAAAGFARRQLVSMSTASANQTTWPALVSITTTNQVLPDGQGGALHAALPQPPDSGASRTNGSPAQWAASALIHHQLLEGSDWDLAAAGARPVPSDTTPWVRSRTDLTVFTIIAAGFYLSILGTAVFWWRFRRLRGKEKTLPGLEPLIAPVTMRRIEERWARRVLGLQIPDQAEHTRFSNAPVEMNFHMQFRAIYKLVVEWRRQENGWEEDDSRLIEEDTDDWLNGLDEFAALAGIYMRWVIKAGAKDGFTRTDPMSENEDSNHIWSRLVMYFSEHYWGMLTLMHGYQNAVLHQDKANFYGQISKLLQSMGMRQRERPFDARRQFNCPSDPSAFDLLTIQKPGMTLSKLMLEVAMKLKIPYSHSVQFVTRFKEFKARENPIPIHPYLIELAKVLPHFLLMGLGAVVWHNQTIGDRPIVPFLWETFSSLALNPVSMLWMIPLFGALLLTVAAHFTRVYRYDARMLPNERQEMMLDATLTSLFVKKHSVMPQANPGRWWQPRLYERAGWTLRTIGFLALASVLFQMDTPSFGTFLVVKGLLAPFCLMEVAAVLLPLAGGWVSRFLQDYVTDHSNCGRGVKFLNSLNITATRPASPFWLSFKYHTQPSVPSGDFWAMTQAVLFYFIFAAAFFFVGAYLCQQVFSLWFTEKYLHSMDWKLVAGGLLFWNTMYLLRYGLFLLATGVASALAAYPIKTVAAGVAAAQFVAVVSGFVPASVTSVTLWMTSLILMMAAFVEEPLLGWLRRRFPLHSNSDQQKKTVETRLAALKADPSATLGIVYMSGDDLSSLKLTPALLMTRWRILRTRLGSESIPMLSQLVGNPSETQLEGWFAELHQLEARHEVTLWSPLQVFVSGENPPFRPELGLNLPVPSADDRQRLLRTWHIRRWLVTMMSTAGHAQDTAITLADIAVRLHAEGLASHTAFYLIQNKYDNNDNNRPSQSAYLKGELGQRNKFARLICELAPGARGYNLQNWTPFGFKAGGLTGMDLAFEESLNLRSMLVLDRNANVHDLDALMDDLKQALTDPDVVIVIPGRGTTNTRTPLGQASQLVEEGHRSFLKGLMTVLGGRASEMVGTGWGNLLAVYYGRVQRAMIDPGTLKMPLTSRMQRGSSFAARAEGLLGFTPHAVGISEDTWAVSQAAHNATALGLRVKFLVSRALWHKIRETWSHSEWLASFPRWSGGFLQMMHDPVMQRINEFGPASVFAKEIRANSGRNYLTALFALANILLMPLAIILDVTPFVQILVVLWNFGFIMNQILTVHGLHTYLVSSGFQRFPALMGGLAAGFWSGSQPGSELIAPAAALVGFLAGGYLAGLSRWLYTRMRDMLLFGPQLVMHALGQFVRQSLEFTVSGAAPEDAKGVNVAFRSWAGPREDRPLDTYPNLINLRTVVWVIGFSSLVLNLVALANLDMLNALLLLPSLLFCVSTLAGPFLLSPKPGQDIRLWTAPARAAGWAGAFGFYLAVSVLVAGGTWGRAAGVLLFTIVWGKVAARGLRYLGFRTRVRRLRNEIQQRLAAGGIPDSAMTKCSSLVMGLAGADQIRIETTLTQTGVDAALQPGLSELVKLRLTPLLRSPMPAVEGHPWRTRFVSETARSFVLGLFTLLWFFIVPVPGLFVFTADAYRLSISLGTILKTVAILVGCTITGLWMGRFMEWWQREGPAQGALIPQTSRLYEEFEAAIRSGRLFRQQDISKIYALFTEVKTYLDQRSYAYVRQTLKLIRESLHAASFMEMETDKR